MRDPELGQAHVWKRKRTADFFAGWRCDIEADDRSLLHSQRGKLAFDREENSTEWGVDPDVTVEMTPEQMRAAQDARQETELGDAVTRTGIDDAFGGDQHDDHRAGQSRHVCHCRHATDHADGRRLTTRPVHKTLLEADPQLAAGLLVIRLELRGAHL